VGGGGSRKRTADQEAHLVQGEKAKKRRRKQRGKYALFPVHQISKHREGIEMPVKPFHLVRAGFPRRC